MKVDREFVERQVLALNVPLVDYSDVLYLRNRNTEDIIARRNCTENKELNAEGILVINHTEKKLYP